MIFPCDKCLAREAYSDGSCDCSVNATKTTPTHWLDILPATPLARGVPVRKHGGDEHGIHDIAHSVYNRGTQVRTVEVGVREDCRDYRVDLDDPQGFGYALKALLSQTGGSAALERQMWTEPGKGPSGPSLYMLMSWVCGDVKDADRLALARAIAEVRS